MQEYKWYHAIFMSFFSRNLYRDVANNWGGKAFLYLLLLLALSWIAETIFFQLGLNQWYRADSDKIVYQIPEMTIKNGVLSTPENHPYIITSPDDINKRIAIIDATGQYQTLEQSKTDLLITKTQIISQSRPNEIKINSIPSSLNIVIEPKVVNQYAKDYLNFAWILFFPFVLFFTFLYRVCQALIYSVIGKIFSGISGADLEYGKILQVSLVAITPAIVIATILDIFSISFRYEYLLYFVLAMIYLYFGISANKNEQKV